VNGESVISPDGKENMEVKREVFTRLLVPDLVLGAMRTGSRLLQGVLCKYANVVYKSPVGTHRVPSDPQGARGVHKGPVTSAKVAITSRDLLLTHICWSKQLFLLLSACLYRYALETMTNAARDTPVYYHLLPLFCVLATRYFWGLQMQISNHSRSAFDAHY